MSETPCLSASIPLRSRQQARIYVVEDGSEEGIPQSESTDFAHGVLMACPLRSSEWNWGASKKPFCRPLKPTDDTEERTVWIDENSLSTIGRMRIELTCVPFGEKDRCRS